MKFWTTLLVLLCVSTYSQAQCRSCGSGGSSAMSYGYSSYAPQMSYASPVQWIDDNTFIQNGKYYIRHADNVFREATQLNVMPNKSASCPCTCGCFKTGNCVCGKTTSNCPECDKAAIEQAKLNSTVKASTLREVAPDPTKALYEDGDGNLYYLDRASVELAQKTDGTILPKGKWTWVSK